MLLAGLPTNLVEPAAAQSDGQSFTIAVQKYNCPPGFDAYSGQGLFQNCTEPQPGIPFSVKDYSTTVPSPNRESPFQLQPTTAITTMKLDTPGTMAAPP